MIKRRSYLPFAVKLGSAVGWEGARAKMDVQIWTNWMAAWGLYLRSCEDMFSLLKLSLIRGWVNSRFSSGENVGLDIVKIGDASGLKESFWMEEDEGGEKRVPTSL